MIPFDDSIPWNRLTEASGAFLGGETLSYVYDPRGNMTSSSHTGGSPALGIDVLEYGDAVAVHALTGVDRDGDGTIEESFDYDAAGNLAEDGNYEFAFDAYGKLREVTELGGAALVTHTYDHLGRRVASEYPGNSSLYFVRAAGAEIRTFAGATVMRKHIPFAGRTIAVVNGTFTNANKASRIFMQATDHLGSPALVFDIAAAPSVVERWAGYPYGAENTEVLAAEGTLADYRAPADPTSKLSTRFQGREIDPGVPEFYDFGARVYRTDLGRFLSADSIVPDPTDSQSWNRYAFVRNNPMGRIDPTGHNDASVFAPSPAQPRCTIDNPTGETRSSVDWSTPQYYDDSNDGPSASMPLGPDEVGKSPQQEMDENVDLLKNIKSGVFGTTGYLLGGRDGAKKGAMVDGVLAPFAAGVGASKPRPSTPAPAAPPAATHDVDVTSATGTGPLGSRRNQLSNVPYQPTRNVDTEIGGRMYGGHALDQMQNRGLMPSVVENTIANGVRTPDPIPGRVRVYEAENRITAILEGERVITVIPGQR